jgi:hypothetical protein
VESHLFWDDGHHFNQHNDMAQVERVADDDSMTAWRKISFLISGEEFYEKIKTKRSWH